MGELNEVEQPCGKYRYLDNGLEIHSQDD